MQSLPRLGMWLPFCSEVEASLVALNYCPLKLGLEFELLLWRKSHDPLSLAGIVLPYTHMYTQPNQYCRYRRAKCNVLSLNLLVCTRDTLAGVLASATNSGYSHASWPVLRSQSAREVTHVMHDGLSRLGSQSDPIVLLGWL